MEPNGDIATVTEKPVEIDWMTRHQAVGGPPPYWIAPTFNVERLEQIAQNTPKSGPCAALANEVEHLLSTLKPAPAFPAREAMGPAQPYKESSR